MSDGVTVRVDLLGNIKGYIQGDLIEWYQAEILLLQY
jgi:hypothetical protein